MRWCSIFRVFFHLLASCIAVSGDAANLSLLRSKPPVTHDLSAEVQFTVRASSAVPLEVPQILTETNPEGSGSDQQQSLQPNQFPQFDDSVAQPNAPNLPRTNAAALPSYFSSSQGGSTDHIFASSQSGALCPKVYIYPLFNELMQARIVASRGRADPPFPNPFGDRLGFGLPGLFSTKTKSTASIFEYSLRTLGDLCLVDNPADATLFYIPWYRDWMCAEDAPCPSMRFEESIFTIVSNYSLGEFKIDYLNRNHGLDHFLTFPSDATSNQVPRELLWRKGLYRNVTSVAPAYYVSVTYPKASYVHFESLFLREDPELQALPWNNFNQESRKWLLFFAYGIGSQIRTGLAEQCIRANEKASLAGTDEPCLVIRTSRQDVYSERAVEVAEKAVLGMKTAKFCLQPPGDFCPRKGIYDSLTLGCIPVLMQPCAAEFARDFIDTMKAMVVLNDDSWYRGLIDRLRRISDWEVEQKQMYIARIAHRVQWSFLKDRQDYEDLPPHAKALVQNDAFFTTLRAIEMNSKYALFCGLELQGSYQDRYRVCCEKGRECDPEKIMARGPVGLCEVGRKLPCAFRTALHFQKQNRNMKNFDVAPFHKMLRGPIPAEE